MLRATCQRRHRVAGPTCAWTNPPAGSPGRRAPAPSRRAADVPAAGGQERPRHEERRGPPRALHRGRKAPPRSGRRRREAQGQDRHGDGQGRRARHRQEHRHGGPAVQQLRSRQHGRHGAGAGHPAAGQGRGRGHHRPVGPHHAQPRGDAARRLRDAARRLLQQPPHAAADRRRDDQPRAHGREDLAALRRPGRLRAGRVARRGRVHRAAVRRARRGLHRRAEGGHREDPPAARQQEADAAGDAGRRTGQQGGAGPRPRAGRAEVHRPARAEEPRPRRPGEVHRLGPVLSDLGSGRPLPGDPRRRGRRRRSAQGVRRRAGDAEEDYRRPLAAGACRRTPAVGGLRRRRGRLGRGHAPAARAGAHLGADGAGRAAAERADAARAGGIPGAADRPDAGGPLRRPGGGALRLDGAHRRRAAARPRRARAGRVAALYRSVARLREAPRPAEGAGGPGRAPLPALPDVDRRRRHADRPRRRGGRAAGDALPHQPRGGAAGRRARRRGHRLPALLDGQRLAEAESAGAPAARVDGTGADGLPRLPAAPPPPDARATVDGRADARDPVAQEHAVGADAGDGRLLADRRAVVPRGRRRRRAADAGPGPLQAHQRRTWPPGGRRGAQARRRVPLGRLRRAGRRRAGRHRRRGALRRPRPLRQEADPHRLVRRRHAGAGHQLLRPGRHAAGQPGRRAEPVLPAGAIVGRDPAVPARHRRGHRRVAGAHHGRLLGHQAGHPAGHHAAAARAAHQRARHRPDLRALHQLGPVRAGRRRRRVLRLVHQAGRRLRRGRHHRHDDHDGDDLLRHPLRLALPAGAVRGGHRHLLRHRRDLPRVQPAEAAARRLVPADDRHLRVHADADVEAGPPAAVRQAARGRHRADRLPRSRLHQPAHARAGHGGVPVGREGLHAQRAAAQPQAQQGAARAEHLRHGEASRGAVGRLRQALRGRGAGPQLLAGGAALRLQERARRARGAGAAEEARRAAGRHGDQLLPQPRHRHSDHRLGHGAVAREAVRQHAPQRRRRGRLPAPADEPHRRAGQQGRDLSGAGSAMKNGPEGPFSFAGLVRPPRRTARWSGAPSSG
ncbi:unnamed protein product [Rotaria sp. Silwood1]|nr:unnamed protein product [Rotaria sp. Silwood1]